MEITFKLYADQQRGPWEIAGGQSVSTATTKEAALGECREKFPPSEGWYGHVAIAVN